MEDIEINIKFTTKLKEILKELVKPKKREIGYVDGRTIVANGLSLIGLDSTDILGFAKEEIDTRTRRTKGAQAWFKRMYEDGWRFVGAFEYEGLLYNGFVIMEREIPNKRLLELIETLTDEEKEIIPIESGIDKGPEIPKLKPIDSDGFYISEQKFKDEMIGPVYKAKTTKVKDPRVIEQEEYMEFVKNAEKQKEGFSEDIEDFIKEAKVDMKSEEELFFDETGRHAIWKGKETIAYKKWKADRE